MAKHTPVSWRYKRDEDDGVTAVRAHVWGPSVSITASGNLDYTEPDMRLIAAAPELLFQLLAAANYIDALGGESKSYRAAIAKANGEA